MRVAILVMLWACGDGGSSVVDSAEPDTGMPPDAQPPPTITGFTFNAYGCRGGIVGLDGANLGPGTATISGVPQTVAGFGPNFFQIRVSDATPAGTAPIVVETVYGTATSPPLEVLDKHTPEVTSLSPTAPNPGNTVTLMGTGLLGTIVQLRAVQPPNGGTAADVTSSSDTSLTFVMPVVAPGEYFVQAGEFPVPPGCGYGGSSGQLVAL